MRENMSVANDYLPIPSSHAKVIAEAYKKSMVLILAYDRLHEKTHCTTYGVTAIDKENAALAGERVVKELGGDLVAKTSYEDFHAKLEPAFFREALEMLGSIADRRGCTLERVQDFMRRAREAELV